MQIKPTFFRTPALFRKWLEPNHKKKTELWVGFYKTRSGRSSITWPEAVDAALSYGWIDGIRKGIDAESYMIRFTPRKRNSIWSAVNIRRAQELIDLGLMTAAGIESFEARKAERSAIYAYEQKESATLAPAYEKQFKENPRAWEYFQKQPPWYRKTSVHRIMTAKQEETRLRRLARLIEDSENQAPIRPYATTKSK